MYNDKYKKKKGEKMKKLKELWMNNRVLFVLGSIVLICFIIICVVCFNFFFGPTKSNYGDRLENVENLPLKEEDKEKVISKLKENETVKNVEVHTQGKIIYIRVSFENVTLDRAQEIAKTSLEVIEEEYQKNYDIHYTLVSEKTETQEGFTLMGAKNINRSVIIWNNNTPIENTGE